MAIPKKADSQHFLPVAIVLVAAALRIDQIATLPPGLFYDESANGIDALRVLAGAHPVFFTGDQGREPLHIYLQALTMALIGPSPFALRLPSVALGILTVAGTVATFRAWAGARVGWIGAALVGASFWHISLSRSALRTDGLPLFAVLALFWLGKGVRTGRARDFAVGGALIGLDQYTYIPARVAPPVLGLWLVGCLLVGVWRGDTSRRRIAIGLAIALAAFALAVSPLADYFLLHPTDFFGRIQSVSATANQDNPVTAVVAGFRQSTLALLWSGDPDPLHNLPGRPLVDLPLGVLGAAGVVLALRRWRNGAMVLGVAWCVAMLAPAALSVEPSHALRLVGELPFIFLFPALALDWLAGKIVLRGHPVGAVLAGAVIVVGTVVTAHDYFAVWAFRPDTLRAFQTDLLDSLDLVARIPPGATAFATARVYEDEVIPLAMVPGARSRFRGFEGLNTFVQPTAEAGPVYYVIASSMVPPGGLPTAARLALLGSTRDRIGQTDGQLYIATSPTTIPPQRELGAWIGEAVEVTGVDVPSRLSPGTTATVALHWTVRGQLPPGHWEFFAHLVDRPQGRLLAQDYNDGFPPSQWRSGDRVLSWFSLPVGLGAPTTIAEVDFGIFDDQTGQRLPVTTLARAPAGDTIVVGPMRIARPIIVPPPAHPLVVHFGPAITLQGYDLDTRSDGVVSLRLHWQADKPVEPDYTVFAHLLNERRQFVTGADGQPGQGQFPTSTWAPGEPILDEHVLAPPTPQLNPTIEFGLYLLSTGQRLEATAADGSPVGDAVTLLPGP